MTIPQEITALYNRISTENRAITTDSRAVPAGSIYIALKGDTFDGNAYAKEALEKGAVLAVVNDKTLTDELTDTEKKSYLFVDNSLIVLQQLATLHRQACSFPIIAIGGSNGKTTTKELTAATLATTYRTHVTQGNLNNEIGVPLTILRMPKDSDIAVIEIGANHPKEHLALLAIVQPTHVLVTNNGADHLEGFGTLAGVRAANKEIYDWALVHNATMFVNAALDDLVADSATDNYGANSTRVLYPNKPHTSIVGTTCTLTHNDTVFQSQLFGSYNEANILAAIAIGEHFSVPLPAIQKAVSEYTPTMKRSQIVTKSDHTLIMDCYNANPSSMTASLTDFFAQPVGGGRIVVVGGMKELGTASDQEHAVVLAFIQKNKDESDTVIVVGPEFYQYRDNYPYHFFENTETAKVFFRELSLSGKTIFLKASRGTAVEKILD